MGVIIVTGVAFATPVTKLSNFCNYLKMKMIRLINMSGFVNVQPIVGATILARGINDSLTFDKKTPIDELVNDGLHLPFGFRNCGHELRG